MPQSSKNKTNRDLSYKEQIMNLKKEIKSLKEKEKQCALMRAKDAENILTHISECIKNPFFSKISASTNDVNMLRIIHALNSLTEQNNARHKKNYQDTMVRIRLIHKYQKYYEEALFYSTGVSLRDFTPIKYSSFFSLADGTEAWPVSCYLN